MKFTMCHMDNETGPPSKKTHRNRQSTKFRNHNNTTQKYTLNKHHVLAVRRVSAVIVFVRRKFKSELVKPCKESLPVIVILAMLLGGGSSPLFLRPVHKVPQSHLSYGACFAVGVLPQSSTRRLRRRQMTVGVCMQVETAVTEWTLATALVKVLTWLLARHSNYTHTHTRLTALCPGLPRWAWTRKVKPIWILLK